MCNSYINATKPKYQQGVVLIVSLVVLMLVTILAITVVNSSTLLQRMAGNTQGLNSAFQAAENGIVYWIEEFNRTRNIDLIKTGTLEDGSTYTVTAKKSDDCGGAGDGNSISAGDDFAGLSSSCFEITSKGEFSVSSTENYIGYATRSLGN